MTKAQLEERTIRARWSAWCDIVFTMRACFSGGGLSWKIQSVLHDGERVAQFVAEQR